MLLLYADVGAVPDLMSAVFAGDRRVQGDQLSGQRRRSQAPVVALRSAPEPGS